MSKSMFKTNVAPWVRENSRARATQWLSRHIGQQMWNGCIASKQSSHPWRMGPGEWCIPAVQHLKI